MVTQGVMEVEREAAFPCVAELERTVQTRTDRRVKDLRISAQNGNVTVTGRSATYYVKQLVTHAIFAVAPNAKLDNRIIV